ncbi:hypothetical protein AVEN_213867-1 [Araneus ventricosus]|uniref:Uncharacterized protein n=1 Tax=Araneus ventricosus TaxID=182803 RepID=A0A4Y2R186_ARAVE|nr:hypothetical protein AVEN_213867-1 [Araneus ventricosus]
MICAIPREMDHVEETTRGFGWKAPQFLMAVRRRRTGYSQVNRKLSAAGSCLHRLLRESTSGTHDTIE